MNTKQSILLSVASSIHSNLSKCEQSDQNNWILNILTQDMKENQDQNDTKKRRCESHPGNLPPSGCGSVTVSHKIREINQISPQLQRLCSFYSYLLGKDIELRCNDEQLFSSKNHLEFTKSSFNLHINGAEIKCVLFINLDRSIHQSVKAGKYRSQVWHFVEKRLQLGYDMQNHSKIEKTVGYLEDAIYECHIWNEYGINMRRDQSQGKQPLHQLQNSKLQPLSKSDMIKQIDLIIDMDKSLVETMTRETAKNIANRAINSMLQDIKLSHAELFLSKEQQRDEQVFKLYIPCVAKSIAEIIQASPNIKFKQECLEILKVEERSLESVTSYLTDKLIHIYRRKKKLCEHTGTSNINK